MKILDLLPPWEISITEILLYLFLQNTTAWTGMLGKKKKKKLKGTKLLPLASEVLNA